jgi:hypothetical protein
MFYIKLPVGAVFERELWQRTAHMFAAISRAYK